MARLGVGGPGLSNTTFVHGVATLRQTMEDNLTATLDFKRAQNNKTFMDIHVWRRPGPQDAPLV